MGLGLGFALLGNRAEATKVREELQDWFTVGRSLPLRLDWSEGRLAKCRPRSIGWREPSTRVLAG